MSPSSADRRPARVALIGAATPEGAALREGLARRGIAGDRVELFGGSSETGSGVVAGQIAEYAGEARLVQEPELERIAACEVIFLCEPGPPAVRLATAPPVGKTVVDLVAAADGAAGNGSPADTGRLVSVPHPTTLVLAGVLGPLHREFDVTDAVAVMMLPAAEYGEAAVDELREQVVSLLSFREPPSGRFGRRLAFDVLPASLVAETAPVEPRVARELAAMLGWPAGRLALSRVIVPVFHGLALALRVRLAARPALEAVSGALAELTPAGRDAPVTPAGAVETGGLAVAGVADDGIGGFWLWVVADDPVGLTAERALGLASEIAGL